MESVTPRTMQVKAPIYSRVFKTLNPKKEFKCDKCTRGQVGIAFESCAMFLHSGEHILVVFVLKKNGTLMIFFILKIKNHCLRKRCYFDFSDFLVCICLILRDLFDSMVLLLTVNGPD